MSKKAEPIWERVSRERLAQKQKEREEFFKSVPPRYEHRKALKEESYTYQTGFQIGSKKEFLDHEILALEMWIKRFRQNGLKYEARLHEELVSLLKNFGWGDPVKLRKKAFSFPDSSKAKKLAGDSIEHERAWGPTYSYLLQAIEELDKNQPDLATLAIKELALMLHRHYDNVEPELLSSYIHVTQGKSRARQKSVYANIRPLARSFASTVREKQPKISSKEIYMAFITHYKNEMPMEGCPEISTFRLWLKDSPEFGIPNHLLEAIESLRLIDSEKADEALEDLKSVYSLQYDQVNPEHLSKTVHQAKYINRPQSRYKEARSLVRPFMDCVLKGKPELSIKSTRDKFGDYIASKGLEDKACNFDSLTLMNWIQEEEKKKA